MGCDTCKQKKENSEQKNKETIDINFIPQSIQEGNYNGNFFIKLIAFFVVIISLPLVLVVLLGQVFLQFFLPKSLPKISKKIKGFFMGLLNSYGKFLHNREVKKRNKQFEKNREYTTDPKGIEIDEVEIFDNNNIKK